MTGLEVYQRGLLDLVKGRGVSYEDPYLRRVAASPELGLMREIAIWWRVFQLEVQCRFTSRLLKRLGCFEETVARYFDNNPTSPYVEELSHDFLGSLATHADPLIRAMSRFEDAFLQVRAGASEEFEVVWDRHPDRVFLALENHGEVPPAERDWVYRMTIGHELASIFVCTREAMAIE